MMKSQLDDVVRSCVVPSFVNMTCRINTHIHDMYVCLHVGISSIISTAVRRKLRCQSSLYGVGVRSQPDVQEMK